MSNWLKSFLIALIVSVASLAFTAGFVWVCWYAASHPLWALHVLLPGIGIVLFLVIWLVVWALIKQMEPADD